MLMFRNSAPVKKKKKKKKNDLFRSLAQNIFEFQNKKTHKRHCSNGHYPPVTSTWMFHKSIWLQKILNANELSLVVSSFSKNLLYQNTTVNLQHHGFFHFKSQKTKSHKIYDNTTISMSNLEALSAFASSYIIEGKEHLYAVIL